MTTEKHRSKQNSPTPAANESHKLAKAKEESAGPTRSSETQHFPIVGIGASAGGLEALDEFFGHLPSDTGMAFVVVTHQHPGQTSLLPELLSRETSMLVVAASDGMLLKPNHVYVSTPGGLLSIVDGRLHRLESSGPNSPRLPIDYFFRSLAYDQKERAICIVLSGTGTDGTLGLKAIKGEAGLAIVQQSKSAKFAGMPTSAEATGLADYVLDPSEMGPQLVIYSKSSLPHARSTTSGKTVDFSNELMQDMFALMRARTGHDFSGYKSSTIRRRCERRMNIHHISQPADYVRYLAENSHEIDVLFKELLISVTSFFRDAQCWKALASEYLPELFHSRGGSNALRAWVPGCATGEEVYTLAIVMQEVGEKLKRHLGVQIFGTDLDSDAIDMARLGRFPEGISADISADRLERYFIHESGNYRVSKEIRDLAIFAPQNLIKDPPFTKLDLLSCRNLLIYLDAELQKRLMPIFHYALKPGGLLMLGSSESVGNFSDLFETVDKKWKIYRRLESNSGVHLLPRLPTSIHPVLSTPRSELDSESPLKIPSIAKLLERLALDRFCPTFVVVNSRGELLHVHGRTGEYLELPEGQVRTNILDMARDGLPHEIAAILRQAAASEGEVLRENVRVKTNGNFTAIQLAALKIQQPESIAGLILLTFRPAPLVRPEEAVVPPLVTPGSLEALQLELQYMRETHQTTLEELETSNEELKSINEELQSTNEEMQSANEELETSKEEMQSLNEELTTVNVELQSKVDGLSQANDDMQNLLNSTDIATIFLDNQLNIKRFTQQATQLITLRPTDVGRPISDLHLRLEGIDLIRNCRSVLDTLAPKKQRVESSEGNWYVMQIMPYRTTQNVVDGLVLTFVNIQDLRDAEKSSELKSYFEAIFDTIREPLLVLDDCAVVVSANRYFCETFRLAPQDVLDKPLMELANGAWNLPKLRDLLESVLPANATIEGFVLEHEFAGIGAKTFLLNARRLGNAVPFPGRVLLAMQDITGLKHG